MPPAPPAGPGEDSPLHKVLGVAARSTGGRDMTSQYKILIPGGAGSCGKHLVVSLLSQGHEVRVIDKDVSPLRSITDKRLTLIQAGIEDRDALKPAGAGGGAVLALARSFSTDT